MEVDYSLRDKPAIMTSTSASASYSPSELALRNILTSPIIGRESISSLVIPRRSVSLSVAVRARTINVNSAQARSQIGVRITNAYVLSPSFLQFSKVPVQILMGGIPGSMHLTLHLKLLYECEGF